MRKYIPLPAYNIINKGPKAIQFYFINTCTEAWLPKSQLKQKDDLFYVTEWLWVKKKAGEHHGPL